MKDLHSHILYGIDDGSDNIDESIKIIKMAYDNGYTDIILTPHYRQINGFTCNNEKKIEIFNNLKKEIKNKKIKMNIYLGNEIALDEDLFYYLEADMIKPLNDSKYLLIELPFNKKVKNLSEYIYALKDKGYKVIIAHPERYRYYKSLREYKKLIKMGVLFQGNYGSLYGKWGKQSMKRLKVMLKKHMIHFLGSDIHHNNEQSYTKLKELKPLLEKLTNDKVMVNDLIDKNITKVIKNEDIKPYDII